MSVDPSQQAQQLSAAAQSQLIEQGKETQVSKIETYAHAFIVTFVLLSASVLRILNKLDTATISTVYGAALGYATGLTARRK